MQLSATDCAYAVTSLLEFPDVQIAAEKKQNEMFNGENQNPNRNVQMQSHDDQKG